ncbi:hypothetical protein CCMSSC00406_0001860 [Pleurotus cornucopiae]|uniref:Uncharacterized protein n=1 Tax=Pleurotus cornucopiae TaxID=5321 RepID=A0ACB7J4L9_PLECO|nr:hypothetical protein CCMSSC00406_0001860 [Pleurotus cornucopiae]
MRLSVSPPSRLKLTATMDDVSTGSDSDYSSSWISWFLSSKGNEYFCEVDEDFILDRFNLTGLNNEVQNYSQALDLITDNLDDEIQDELRGTLDVQARVLYGLIHARWIVTARGLTKMIDKYKRAEFGRCPRVLCQLQALLPVGLTDIPYEKSVKLYCGRCEDLYSPKSSRHGSIDGAYFGTTFPHLLFLVYPTLIPPKSGAMDPAPSSRDGDSRRTRRTREEPEQEGGGEMLSTAGIALKAERYRPKIYGFQLHEIAKLQRWQEAVRDRQIARLEELEERMAHGFTGTKEMNLAPYAEAFASAGYACIVFDYRRWGTSDGTPRNMVNVAVQLEDFHTVINLSGESSLSAELLFGEIVLIDESAGGHAITLASDISLNIAAAVTQCPLTGVACKVPFGPGMMMTLCAAVYDWFR